MKLRVVAWNVSQPSLQNAPRFAEVIAGLDPAVAFLTEWSPMKGGGAEIARSLEERGWPVQSVAHWSNPEFDGTDVRRKHWGVLAASRTPFERVAVQVPLVAPGSWLEMHVAGLTVVGTRVLSPAPGGYWRWLLAQLERLSNVPALVIGDLNIAGHLIGSKADPGLGRALRSGWIDAGSSSGDARDTFFSRTDGEPRRLDYCLSSPAFRGTTLVSCPLEASEIRLSGPKELGPRLSDHAPLVVDIAW